ncbi:MAG TPA: putative manganese-dependent inorganic diphosphatase [Clostridiaceae bacterium]|nr:putative manganese-dependent inorganic diphosphatase [Clostridiaceae bacterium]
MNNVIYITGHKNPDTDSICAAIAYAELKRRLGINAEARRLGEINRETEFVLNYFNVPVPDILTTVKTQISDLDIDAVYPASPDISIRTAWMIMQKNNIKVIPVVDEHDRLIGIVTLSDITNKYLNIMESAIIASSKTPLQNVIETLNGRLLCGSPESFSVTGKVVIAAMASNELTPFIEQGDIVIVGNLKDNQLKAVELGAGCIVVTCGCEVDKDVLDVAREKNCVILTTPNDTFTTAMLINQSIPIGHVMTSKDIISFNIDDYVDDIKDIMLQTRFRTYPVVDDSNRIKGFISRYHLISKRKKKLILLDHNEVNQTVDGIDQAEILEVIDHHKVGDIQTKNPIYFRNEPLGSTSTIISNLYSDNGIRPSRSIAGILCAAIISDTLKFKSPTCTYADITAAKRLASFCGIDIDNFANAMFKAGSSLKGKTPKEILNNDFKSFNIGKYKIGIGQINTMDAESIQEMRHEIIDYMEETCESRDYNLLMLLVTDILREGSEVLYAGREQWLIEKAFDVELKNGSVFLPGVVSRKKQVVPLLSVAAE